MTFKGILLGASALAVLCSAGAALAQPVEEIEDDEIIVFGEKRGRTLQDTQASVAVVSEEQIRELGIQSFRDAFRVSANILDADWSDAGFIIRGVNSEGLTPGGSPLAALYIDGAQQTVQGARRGARGAWDVSQIEVYRGPQSTLSGRAALAGAIYVTTNNPTYEWEAQANLTVGTLETWQAGVAFGGPILDDQIAFRIAAEFQTEESDLNYQGYSGFDRFDNFIDDEYYQIRGKLLIEPDALPGWSGLLTYSYSADSPHYDDIAGPGLGFPYSARRGDLNASLPFFQDNREGEAHNFSFDVTKDLTDALSFRSLTTASYSETNKPSINEGTPGEVFTSNGEIDQRLITQEFLLNFDKGEDAVSWVAGLYYLTEDTRDINRRSTFFGGGSTNATAAEIDTTNVAIFGEATWPILPTVDIIAGGRVQYEEQDVELFAASGAFNPALAAVPIGGGTDDSVEFLPKGSIVWEFLPDRTIGFTAARGFRAGGVFVNPVTEAATSFDAETTWTYEVSFRSELFDGQATVNANAFYTDWQNQQVELQLVPGDFQSVITANAGQSSLYGFELEMRGDITAELSAFASIGYVETEFDEFVTTEFDLTGSDFPEAPNWTIAGGFNYVLPSGFFVGGDAKYVDAYLSRDIQNFPPDPVGDYIVANFRGGWRGDGLMVMLFADNAFNEDYFVYQDTFDFDADGVIDFDCCATLGPRRVYGISVDVAL
ncbi:MAG: TonB-dependent receptor [Pseudomonadota bacterium]